MDAEIKRRTLDIHLAEFEKLKDEQTARIGFRDNLLYVTLGALGAVVSFGVTDPNRYPALLVLPVSFVLGWTYLVNDQKISAIGRYIRHDLCDRLSLLIDPIEASHLLGWEVAHRSDQHRKLRKRLQLVVDELTFVGSGAVGLGMYAYLTTDPPWPACAAFAVGAVMLVSLAVAIFAFVDVAEGK